MLLLINRRVRGIAWVILCSSLACNAEPDAAPKQQVSKRSWAEVKEEIDEAFNASRERITSVIRKQPLVATFGGTAGSSCRPGTSYMEIIYDRTPIDGPRTPILIIDARIERDYDTSTGKASPFRIVRYLVKDEGHEIIAEVVSFFKRKNWPYEIVDRKKNPAGENGKNDTDKKNTGAKVSPII